MHGLRQWSLLHEASIELLIDSGRMRFIKFKTNKDNIKFLEIRTKIKCDD